MAGVMAVGRDVPIAPHRVMRVGNGGASREARRPSIAPYRNGTVWQMERATGPDYGAARKRGSAGCGARERAATGRARERGSSGSGEGELFRY